MTNTAETFQIPVSRVAELQEKIDKLNKKAVKLGTPPIRMTVTASTHEIVVNVGGTIAAMRRSPIISYTAVDVIIEGETPKLNGWEFLSVVMHRPAGNEFMNLTDSDADLSEFVFTDKHCDHCKKNRVRNATFLVRHEGGFIMQVGSTCLTDFTGVKSPQAHAKHIENILTLFIALRTGGFTTGRTTKKFFLNEWMAWVNKSVRERGSYISRNRAYDTGEATTGEVAKAVILAAQTDVNAVAPTDADYDLADAQIAWIRTDEGREAMAGMGDYGTQLLAATASDDADAIAENTMNIVAPLAAFYARAQADAVKPVSEHQGNVKDRMEMVLKVTRKGNEYENGFGGTTTPYTLQDKQGNVYVWFATGRNHMDQGTCYKIAGTIKKHDEYRGVKQTILTRCKVLKEVGRVA